MSAPATDWFDRAACKGAPQSIWFTEEKGPGANDLAKRVCSTLCTVTDECLAYAKYHRIEYGVWGSQTPRERGVRLRAVKVLECHECGRDFEWQPFPGWPTPKCCGPTCVAKARARTHFGAGDQRGRESA